MMRRRGPPFVLKVLEAAIAQLAEVGFERLSIPEIAHQAGANKTSVYRRWPTKGELVREALEAAMGPAREAPSSGNLRTDLLAAAAVAAAFAASPRGRGALRMLFAEQVNPRVRDLAAAMLRRDTAAAPHSILDRAIERGELPRGTDVELVLSTVAGAIMHRVFVEQAPLSEEYLAGLVDLVLFGACRRRGKHAAQRRSTHRP